MTFGIYGGGVAGAAEGIVSGPPDDLGKVHAALEELRGSTTRLVFRCYDSFQDPGSPLWSFARAPADYERYAIAGARPLDLVLQYRSASGDVAGYLDFVRTTIARHAPLLHSVQITEEANFTTGPAIIDGSYPGVCAALIEGVQAAKTLLQSLGRDKVRVGFNSTPTFGPTAEFWTRIGQGGPEFLKSLDYVGIDFFPDVFRRVAEDGQPGDLESAVAGVLETMRSTWLPRAAIPARVPIHIAEHGWPTSWGRSERRQAQVIERVVRRIHASRERWNVAHYSLFGLRDAAIQTAGNEADLFSFFGIMTARYEPKPAFETFRRLIAEFG